MAGTYHTMDAVEETVDRLRGVVRDVSEGVKVPHSSPTPHGRWLQASDADAIVAQLETAVHGSVFAEVLSDQQIRLQLVRTIQDVLIRQIEYSFMHRVDPWGNPWAPLKQPSRATGAMQRQAIESVRQGSVGPEGFRSAEGLQVFYWRYQDQGTSRIPARPFWAVSSEVVDAVNEMVVDESVKRLSANIAGEMGGLPWEQ